MKILMLTWEYPPRIVGGIARVVHDLSQKLVKEGNEGTRPDCPHRAIWTRPQLLT